MKFYDEIEMEILYPLDTITTSGGQENPGTESDEKDDTEIDWWG